MNLDKSVNIEDFSDLGQPFDFTYLGRNYTVPPIPPSIAKKLIKISTEIGKKANIKENPDDVGIEEEKIDMEAISNDASEMFDNQIRFIAESGIKEIVKVDNSEEVKYVPVPISEIESNWSTQLVVKIFEKVNGIIFGSDKKVEEKKL